MRLVIITGMSGAGKSRTVAAFEDMGYYCMDNIPPSLVPRFLDLCKSSADRITRVALVVDIRGVNLFESFFEQLEEIKKSGYGYELLYLDSSDEILVNRHKETRRKHPLSDAFGGSLKKALEYEREQLSPLVEDADYVINTDEFSPAELKEKINELFSEGNHEQLTVNVMSFGFKYGMPTDADLVFDVRFLPNPFYIDELRAQTGLENEVREYVFGFPEAVIYYDMIMDMIRFMVPHLIKEGRSRLVMAVGCTGGRHRSVAFAEQIFYDLMTDGLPATIYHRNVTRGSGGN